MSKYTIGGFIVALLVIFALIFLFMNLEKNERTNRVTEENLKFINSTFDDTR
jgi:predicted membrane protein